MGTFRICRLSIAFAIFVVFVVAPMSYGERTARLIENPTRTGVSVTADTDLLDGSVVASVHLTVRNTSTNVLRIDLARSSFRSPDGSVYPLSAVVGGDFSVAMLPGESVTGTIAALDPAAVGDRWAVVLVWVLGANVDTATWVWEMADVVIATSSAPATTVEDPAAEPAADSPTATATPVDTSRADLWIGILALVVGLSLLALLAWGVWHLAGS